MRLGALICKHDASNKSGNTRSYHPRGSADAQRLASDDSKLHHSQTSSSPEDWAPHRHPGEFTGSIFANRSPIAEAIDGDSHIKMKAGMSGDMDRPEQKRETALWDKVLTLLHF